MLELAALNIAISIDSLLISIVIGRQTKSIKSALLRPLIFAFTQATLVLIGYFFGNRILAYIYHIDHWIIFGCFSFLAIKQFLDNSEPNIKSKNIWFQSILTSFDGLLIGFTLSMEDYSVNLILLITLIITYLLSFFGIYLGRNANRINPSLINRISSIVLLLIGSKILIEHLIRHYY
jgi:manganese efflux pump family protein